MTTRRCAGCDQTLPLDRAHYYYDRAHASGFQRQCIPCVRRRLDALDAPDTTAVAEPAEATLTLVAEVFADEIALAFVRYADAHDHDLFWHLADFMAGPLPDTDDEDVYDAAVLAEEERCPAAGWLRCCPGMPVG